MQIEESSCTYHYILRSYLIHYYKMPLLSPHVMWLVTNQLLYGKINLAMVSYLLICPFYVNQHVLGNQISQSSHANEVGNFEIVELLSSNVLLTKIYAHHLPRSVHQITAIIP